MKKLDDAVKRFGAPDHGRTAKRLRDFEAQLVADGTLKNAGAAQACCEFMLLNGSCHVHKAFNGVYDQPGFRPRNENDHIHVPFNLEVGMAPIMLPGSASKAERDAVQFGSEGHETSISRHRSVIQSLHELLNQRDAEIERLKHRRTNWKVELLFTGFCLCLMAAYAWWKFHYA